MRNQEGYIGVFDSGVGGISVLRQLCREMPHEHFLYYGDSANAPYGTRPTHEIQGLTMAAAQHLWGQGVKALVVACNTATAAAIEVLRERWPDRIIIGIEPAVKLAVDIASARTIGVMATPATLGEKKFARMMEQYGQTHRILKIPAPGLVELVEQGKGNGMEAEQLLHGLLDAYREEIDVLVLGCTHYPFASDAIARVVGSGVQVLDGSYGTARETRRRLEKAGLLATEGISNVVFENSMDDPKILALCRSLLQQAVKNDQKERSVEV